MNNTGGAWVRAVMAWRAERMGGQVVHMAGPRGDVADCTVRRRIIKRVMGWALCGMGNRRGDQVVVMTVFAVNGEGSRFAIGDGCLDFAGKRSLVDAARFSGQANSISGVGMTTGAGVLVDTKKIGKIVADMASIAIPKNKFGIIQIIV